MTVFPSFSVNNARGRTHGGASSSIGGDTGLWRSRYSSHLLFRHLEEIAAALEGLTAAPLASGCGSMCLLDIHPIGRVDMMEKRSLVRSHLRLTLYTGRDDIQKPISCCEAMRLISTNVLMGRNS